MEGEDGTSRDRVSVTPDHTMKQQIFDLLEVEASCGITLTESMAMKPLSTVSGFYLGGEDAGYFTLHGISEQQLEHYTQLPDVLGMRFWT